MSLRLGCEMSICLYPIGVQLIRFLGTVDAYLQADEVLRPSPVKSP